MIYSIQSRHKQILLKIMQLYTVLLSFLLIYYHFSILESQINQKIVHLSYTIIALPILLSLNQPIKILTISPLKRLLIPKQSDHGYYLSDTTVLRITRSVHFTNIANDPYLVEYLESNMKSIISKATDTFEEDRLRDIIKVVEHNLKFDIFNLERRERWTLEIIVDDGLVNVSILTISGQEGYILREICQIIESAIPVKIEERNVHQFGETVFRTPSTMKSENKQDSKDKWDNYVVIKQKLSEYENNYPDGIFNLDQKENNETCSFMLKRKIRFKRYWAILTLAFPFIVFIFGISGFAFIRVGDDSIGNITSAIVFLIFGGFVFLIHLSSLAVILAILSPYFFRPEFFWFSPNYITKFRPIWLGKKLMHQLPSSQVNVFIRRAFDNLNIHFYTVEIISETEIIILPTLVTYQEASAIKNILETMYPPKKPKIVIP